MLAACYCQRRRSKQIFKKNTDTRLYLCGIRHYALITSSLVILCFRYSVFLFEFTIIFCLLVNVPRVVQKPNCWLDKINIYRCRTVGVFRPECIL